MRLLRELALDSDRQVALLEFVPATLQVLQAHGGKGPDPTLDAACVEFLVNVSQGPSDAGVGNTLRSALTPVLQVAALRVAALAVATSTLLFVGNLAWHLGPGSPEAVAVQREAAALAIRLLTCHAGRDRWAGLAGLWCVYNPLTEDGCGGFGAVEAAAPCSTLELQRVAQQRVHVVAYPPATK
jgi:hypothetical protein